MCDANYRWSPAEAKPFPRAIGDGNPTWIEAPLDQDDARALADPRRSARIPAGAGPQPPAARRQRDGRRAAP